MVVLHRHPWKVVQFDADLMRGRMQVSLVYLVENGGNQKANIVRNNAEGSRKTSQGFFELSL